MKKVFVFILTCVAFMACSKDDGGNVIKKATVRGAQLIYQNSVGTRATTEEVQRFMAVDKEGNVNPIRFITENGDTLDMRIEKIKNLNDEYLALSGYFSFNGVWMHNLLVNKHTELIYAMPRDIYCDDDALSFEDNHKNLYWAKWNQNGMIYRFDVSDPDNITVENYLPNTAGYLDRYYCINGSGFCYYWDRFENIKCPGGRIYNMKELIPGSDGWIENIFCGFNRQFYVVDRIRDENGNYKYDAIYRLDEIGNNELNAILLAEDDYYGWIGDFCPNAKRKTFIMSTGSTTYEFNEETGEMRAIGVVIPITYFYTTRSDLNFNTFLTSESLWVIEETELYQLNLADYSLRKIDLIQCGYEIREDNITSSPNVPGLSFSGLRYADGQNVVGTIQEDGTITAFEKTKTSNPITTLLRLN